MTRIVVSDTKVINLAGQQALPVVNAPEYAADEVATHALALLLACVRRVPAYDRSVRDGAWEPMDVRSENNHE